MAEVLYTAEITREERQLANESGISLLVQPFTRIELHKIGINQFSKGAGPFIFTSKNAVRAFTSSEELSTGISRNHPIYAVGSGTRALLDQAGFTMVREGSSGAAELARDIMKDQHREVVFFCGNKRREILPEELRKSGVKCTEIISYETIPVCPEIIQDHFDAAAYLSPSGVDSVVHCTEDRFKHLPSFAIGNTTAERLRQQGFHEIYIASRPVLSELFTLIHKQIKNG
jgi:uroporphyrinogen-III synthase